MPPQATAPHPGGTPPAAPPAPSAAPEDFPLRSGRVHIAAHQRGTDATALGTLALHVPNALMSLVVMVLLGAVLEAWIGLPGWLLVVGWLGTGALVFHHSTERILARHMFQLRYPTRAEEERLRPLWHEITARAGVDGRTYQLWIQDSRDLNAMAAAGHIVGVTTYALHELPPKQLAGVLAHELAHHTGGHSWSSLLAYWYSMPGRLAWQALRVVVLFISGIAPALSCLLVLFFLGIVIAAVAATKGLILLPLVTPYLVAAVGRRAELRADRHAAALGFAPEMMEVLAKLHAEEESARETAAAQGGQPAAGAASRLLSSHPDHHTRLHHLQAFLDQSR